MFKARSLESHNALRALHGAPPLRWSAECAKYAEAAANVNQDANCMRHCCTKTKAGKQMGQNIGFSTQRKALTEEAAVAMWHKEGEDPGYDFGQPGYQAGTGHFR